MKYSFFKELFIFNINSDASDILFDDNDGVNDEFCPKANCDVVLS